MLKKISTFLKNLYRYPILTLNDDCLCNLKNDREALSKNIEAISSHIDVAFNQQNFFLEPDEEFYKKPPHAQAWIIQNKIGLFSIYCPIRFAGGGMFDISSGKFTQKTMPKPLFDIETKSLRWEKDDTPEFEIEINYKFRDNPIIIGGILAHELTHLYFYSRGLSKIFPNSQTEEQCCDLTIFLLGLGKLVLNSFFQEVTYQDYDKITTMSLGHYLPWYHLCYIYEKINRIKAIPEEVSTKNLNEGAIIKLTAIKQYPELFES